MLNREELQQKRDIIIKYILKNVFKNPKEIFGGNDFISISRRKLEEEINDPLMMNIINRLTTVDSSIKYHSLQLGNNIIYDIDENTLEYKHCLFVYRRGEEDQTRTKINIKYNITKEYDNCKITVNNDKVIKFTL